MKTLVQRLPTNTNPPFDLELLKQHLRVSGDEEDEAITNIGLTAAAELEQFAQVALLFQTIHIVALASDLSKGFMSLPIGPFIDGGAVSLRIDEVQVDNPSVFSGSRPVICWPDQFKSIQPRKLLIEYRAGFGADASDIPADLSQALRDQAALHYDGRSPMDAKSLTTSPHMARVGARYRGVSI